MPGFGNLGQSSGWSPLSGFGRQRSLAPGPGSSSQQSSGWTQPSAWGGVGGAASAGGGGGIAGGGFGSPVAQPRARQPLAGAGGNSYQPQQSGGGDPISAYKAAQNMPTPGGYSTVGFDPTPQLQPRAAAPSRTAAGRPAGDPSAPLDNAQPMPKPSPDSYDSLPAKAPGGPAGPSQAQAPINPAQQPSQRQAPVDYYRDIYPQLPSVTAPPVNPRASLPGGPQPANTLQPLGSPYGIGDTPPQWVLDAQRQAGSVDWGTPSGLLRQQQLQGGGPVGPMMSDQAAASQMGFRTTQDPTIWQTGTGATYNATGARDQSEPYDVWRRRVYGV